MIFYYDKIRFKATTKDHRLIFDWYLTPQTNVLDWFLNYYSHHLITHKRRIIIGHKILFLSHPEFYQKYFNLVINALLNNDYPLDLIFYQQDKLTKFHFLSNCNGESSNYSANNKDLYFIIPYVANIVTKFIHFFLKHFQHKISFHRNQ